MPCPASSMACIGPASTWSPSRRCSPAESGRGDLTQAGRAAHAIEPPGPTGSSGSRARPSIGGADASPGFARRARGPDRLSWADTIVGATLVVPTLPRLPWGLGQMTTSLMTAGTCRRAARGRS
jgi:hypothetical protein